MSILVYGANGYTGRLIAERAHRVGVRPILAGRRADAVAPIAAELGFEHRVFPLDTPAQIARSLVGVSAVLLAAGPFSATSAPMLEACIMAGVHYLDITGEIAVFEHCAAQHERALAAGVVVLPGVGFDVVPSDCLAATLAAALPGATHLELAFASAGGSGPRISRGTARTMLEGFGQGGAVRQESRIQRVPLAWRTRRVAFRDKERTTASIPWGDVATAYYSTGIPDIVVYTAMPRRQIRALGLARLLAPIVRLHAVKQFVARRIERGAPGPDENTRRNARTQLWGRVVDADGRSAEATLVTTESYRLTAETAVESARRVAAGLVTPGFRTPSLAFGAGYIAEFDGCDIAMSP
ncbi:MAG TPA: saccharopine dehydrogenase NADP-binding domain-containing protein [Gemmatimonadaceae bacterium]